MRWNSFARSALFAAAAALLAVPVFLLLAPLFGAHTAVASLAIALSAAYVAGIAGHVRRGLGAAALAGLLGLLVCAIAESLPEVAIGTAVVLAVVRGGLLHRGRGRARTLAVEVFLGVAALLVARFLADASIVGLALTVWGFFLVQSFFFLLGAGPGAVRVHPEVDPFEQARGRLLELFENELI
jgi:hypothetical protein